MEAKFKINEEVIYGLKTNIKFKIVRIIFTETSILYDLFDCSLGKIITDIGQNIIFSSIEDYNKYNDELIKNSKFNY